MGTDEMGRWTDEEVLVASRTDTAAFEELYRRHVDKTVRFAARRAGSPQDVVDLVAAVWLEVIASLDRFDPTRGPALPWILGIAANLCAVESRRRARERDVVQRLAGRRLLADDDYERLEREIDAARVAPRLQAAVKSLPVSERMVAELVLFDELTPADVALALGIRPAAVRMRLARARAKLRKTVVELEAFTSADPLEEVVP